MLKAIKKPAYIFSAVAILSVFFTGIAPMLLNAPPSGPMLAVTVLVVALMLYALSAGPVWVLQRHGAARRYIRERLNATTALMGVVVALCVALPVVPTAASLVSGSVAGVALLLRAVASTGGGPRIPGEWIG